MTNSRFSPDLNDFIQYDPLGRAIVPLSTMAMFWGVSSQEAQSEYDRQMAEHGQFRILKSWYYNAKALQATYGTADGRELFSRIVLDGGAE